MSKVLTAVLAAAIMLCAAVSLAGVPQAINYQAKLEKNRHIM